MERQHDPALSPDAASGGYGQAFSFYHSDANAEAIRKILEPYMNLYAKCKAVLDIGCGPGIFLEMLREQKQSRRLAGIDLDPEMVSRVKQKGFDAYVMRAEDIGRELHEKFDAIYAGHVIEHMAGTDTLKLLKDCFECLNPMGLLVLRTPNWEHPFVRHEGFWLDVTHVRPYPGRLLIKLLTDIGFASVKTCVDAGQQDTVAMAVKPPER